MINVHFTMNVAVSSQQKYFIIDVPI